MRGRTVHAKSSQWGDKNGQHFGREAILACIAFAYDVIELEACQADWSLRNEQL
ncbi:MAG: hypothetical protein LASZOEIN_000143 [Candidatus Fervidibacter sp.]